MKYYATNEEETAHIAARFAKSLKKGDIIAFYGTLGAGKTFFCRALIRALTDKNNEVPSPTFTLLQSYDTPDFTVYHFDFYRLKEPEEAYEIGIEEAFYDGVSLIEWPEKIGALLPLKAKKVSIKILADGAREIDIDEGDDNG